VPLRWQRGWEPGGVPSNNTVAGPQTFLDANLASEAPREGLQYLHIVEQHNACELLSVPGVLVLEHVAVRLSMLSMFQGGE
jgi:hypothetical protein